MLICANPCYPYESVLIRAGPCWSVGSVGKISIRQTQGVTSILHAILLLEPWPRAHPTEFVFARGTFLWTENSPHRKKWHSDRTKNQNISHCFKIQSRAYARVASSDDAVQVMRSRLKTKASANSFGHPSAISANVSELRHVHGVQRSDQRRRLGKCCALFE